MEILNFVLGMLTVIFIGMVVGMFMMARSIKHLKNGVENLWDTMEHAQRRISEVSELDNRRIDGEIDRTDRIVGDIYSAIDSRLDKLENKLSNKK